MNFISLTIGALAGVFVWKAMRGDRADAHELRNSDGASLLVHCLIILALVVGGAWLFGWPHGGNGGRHDGQIGFGGTLLGDPFGLRGNGGR